MDVPRFSKSTSGHVIKVGRGEAAYNAFVPAPVPPALEPTWELTAALSEADRAVGELAGLTGAAPNPGIFIAPLAHREAVLSSRIEGTRADLADLYAYEAGQKPESKQAEADVREVSNYARALEYGVQRLPELPVSLRLMRELHERLMEGVRGECATPGEFRRTQNWIGPPGSSLADATYVPPPVPEMMEALGALETYLHARDSTPPLIRLAFAHYQFEAIHPFVDGNGRIGRLLIPLLAVDWGILPQPTLYLSAFFERNRDDYYRLLLGVSRDARWGEWIAYFLQAVSQQARETVQKARRLQELEVEWRRRLMEMRASTLALRLLESLFTSPVVTIRQAQDLLGVAYNSAHLAVGKLVDAGVLSATTEGARGRSFAADAVLRVVGRR